MSHASLKEQLQAIASQITDKASPKSNKAQEDKRKALPQQAKKTERSPRNEKPKPRWLDFVHYGVELLRVYFPSTFFPPNQVKPLKKGIKNDLVLRLSTLDKVTTEDKACMVKSLAYYVNTMSYLKSVVSGSPRIDLDGNNAGIVSEEEAKYSAERYLSKLKTKHVTSQKPEEKNEEVLAESAESI